MSDKPVRLLLVEDDGVDAMAFKRLVKEENLPYDYVVASSVKEARQALQAERFDMIVADFMLGDGTSFDILADCRDTPFIVVTGTGNEETAVEMMKRGARDYLLKDADGKYLKVLSATVRNALAHEAAQRELRHYRDNLEGLVHERTAELEAEIQERLRTERDKQVLQEQLHQAQKMEAIGQLAAGVAHDFNNMLMVVSINAERIRSECADPAFVECAEMILAAASQASGVTRSLLTFSREIPGQKQRTNLRDVVRKSGMLLTKLLPASIDLEMVNEQDCWIHGDPIQIQQVILNLAINARDAMPKGGQLRIETSSAACGDGQASNKPAPVRLIIADTGTGMTADVKKRIFEPFFTTKPRGQGTGLGLAIVHGVLRNHDAHVEIESESGKGTRFTVTFAGAPSEVESERPDRLGPLRAGRRRMHPHCRGQRLPPFAHRQRSGRPRISIDRGPGRDRTPGTVPPACRRGRPGHPGSGDAQDRRRSVPQDHPSRELLVTGGYHHRQSSR